MDTMMDTPFFAEKRITMVQLSRIIIVIISFFLVT